MTILTGVLALVPGIWAGSRWPSCGLGLSRADSRVKDAPLANDAPLMLFT